MTERVSDQRLADLIADYDAQLGRMRGIGHHEGDGDVLEQYADTAAALRELQRLRANVAALTPDQRVDHFAAAARGYCLACGRETDGICHCENDE